jgi:hypothetical protein
MRKRCGLTFQERFLQLAGLLWSAIVRLYQQQVLFADSECVRARGFIFLHRTR